MDSQDDSDGLMLNILPYKPKSFIKTNFKHQEPTKKDVVKDIAKKISKISNKPSKLKKTHNHSNSNDDLFNETKNKQNKTTNDSKDVPNSSTKVKKKEHRKFIPESEFTPVSSLFNKNPEIPIVEPSVCEGNVDKQLFTSNSFQDLPIHDHLKQNLQKNMGYKSMTRVQQLAFNPILQGTDCLVKSVTGSGKTLCYALAIVNRLMNIQPKITRFDGVYAVVIVPTRELALQSYETIQELCKACVWIVPGLIIGGDNCKAEKARLRKGINIIVATPGRLLYHMEATKNLDLSRVMFMVLDEADRLLDMGFEKQMVDILNHINQYDSVERQSILLSATLSPQVENLAQISLKDPKFVDASSQMEKVNISKQVEGKIDDSEKAHDIEKGNISDTNFVVPNTLTQSYMIVPCKLRLVVLVGAILKTLSNLNERKSAMVFLSSIAAVDFHFTVLKDVILPFLKQRLPALSSVKDIYKLHGDMNQEQRFSTLKKFKKSSGAVLFSTDVAARGLDLPQVSLVVQYSCPPQVEDYLHRVGRTARIGAEGKALILLLPSELTYKDILERHHVSMNQLDLSEFLQFFVAKKKLRSDQSVVQAAATDLQNQIEESIAASQELTKLAHTGYEKFVQSYATYPSEFKPFLHVRFLHLGHVAKSYGLREAPQKMSKADARNKASKRKREAQAKMDVEKKMRLNEERYIRDEIVSGPMVGGSKARKNLNKAKKKKKIRL